MIKPLQRLYHYFSIWKERIMLLLSNNQLLRWQKPVCRRRREITHQLSGADSQAKVVHVEDNSIRRCL